MKKGRYPPHGIRLSLSSHWQDFRVMGKGNSVLKRFSLLSVAESDLVSVSNKHEMKKCLARVFWLATPPRITEVPRLKLQEDALRGQLCDCSCFALGLEMRAASVTEVSSLILAVVWPGTIIWSLAPYSCGLCTSASQFEVFQSLDFDYSCIFIIKMNFIIKKTFMRQFLQTFLLHYLI